MSLVSVAALDHATLIAMDDGKVNALSHAMIDAIARAFDDAPKKNPIILTGRPGVFSAGFSLQTMMASPDAAVDLTRHGFELMLRVYEDPRPVIAACTGHAVAGGALLLLCADVRVGTRGTFRIGLTEVSIGIPLPTFARLLAEERMARPYLLEATLGARIFPPMEALAAGFFTRTIDAAQLMEIAQEEAERLAGFSPRAYASTKRVMCESLVGRSRAELEGDLARALASVS